MRTTARVKLHDWDKAMAGVSRALSSALAGPVPNHVIKYLRWLLAHNQQATGDRMPTKGQTASGPAMLRAYKRKGWDTKHYLIASGESTKLAFSIHNNGALVRIEPRRPNILGYHSPDDPHHGEVIWMELDEKEEQDVLNILAAAVEKAVK